MKTSSSVYLFEMPDPNRHYACRVNDHITWQGMRAVLIQNELIQVLILADKGTEIVQFLYKPTDTDFLWHSKHALHNPGAYPKLAGDDAATFFDHWSGGWFEAFPNNGWCKTYKNSYLGFFGETLNVPWEVTILKDTPQEVRVGFWFKTFRSPFIIQKVIGIKSGIPALFFDEQITNIGGETLDFAWGHHPVVGPPFLDKHCRISMPDCKVVTFHDEDGPGNRMKLFQEAPWPIIKGVDDKPLDLRLVPGPESNSMDNCYMIDFIDEAFCAVTNTQQKVGFGLSWDVSVFRYFWLWQALGGGEGWPWYHGSYQMAIEPWTTYPCTGLLDAIERGTTLQLEPGEKVNAWMTAVAYASDKDVASIKQDGRVIFAD